VPPPATIGNPTLKPLDPFLFLLIAIAGCMSQRQAWAVL